MPETELQELESLEGRAERCAGLSDAEMAEMAERALNIADAHPFGGSSSDRAFAHRAMTVAENIDAELLRRRRGRLQPVTAAGRPQAAGHAARMAQGRRPTPSPERIPTPSPLLAADSGAAIASADELAELMCSALNRMSRSDPPAQRGRLIARRDWRDDYPDARRLVAGDTTSNSRKVEAICSPRAQRFDRRSGALVASGGICAPVNVDYSMPTWATADRPLRDGLPSFQASRGGLSFVQPPDIGVPSLQGGTASGLAAATGVWSEATDADPAGAIKPVVSVACNSPTTVYVDSVPTRIGFGNTQGRFSPEQVAANTEQALAAAAREQELNLLVKMYGASKQVNPQRYLGAARDLLTTAELLVRQYRGSHRIPASATMTAVFPEWAQGIIAADLARELAHDNAGSVDVLAITADDIERWLGARGIGNVIWTLDGLQGATYGTGDSALLNQFFPVATANDEPQWPNQADDGTVQVGWLLYVEGTYQYLDGGELDLGVVRDSTLDATNDYETFTEVFESVAFRGLESYQVQSVVQPTGASAAGSTGTYHE